MKIVQLLVTTYLIFIYTNNSLALEKTERRKGSKNARKLLSWRLKLLKKISGRIKRLRGVNKTRKDVIYGCIDEEKSLDYDVPVLLCPTREDEELLPCPSLDRKNRVVCIGEHALCDRKLQCPRGEDEDFALCMFYKALRQDFRGITRAISDISSRVYQLEASQSQSKRAVSFPLF
ncbi:hypothetical protein ScPMuIL_011942 [Solemya velum]